MKNLQEYKQQILYFQAGLILFLITRILGIYIDKQLLETSMTYSIVINSINFITAMLIAIVIFKKHKTLRKTRINIFETTTGGKFRALTNEFNNNLMRDLILTLVTISLAGTFLFLTNNHAHIVFWCMLPPIAIYSFGAYHLKKAHNDGRL